MDCNTVRLPIRQPAKASVFTGRFLAVNGSHRDSVYTASAALQSSTRHESRAGSGTTGLSMDLAGVQLTDCPINNRGLKVERNTANQSPLSSSVDHDQL